MISTDTKPGANYQTKLQIAHVIFESIAAGQPVTDKQRDELMRFLFPHHEPNPDPVAGGETARARNAALEEAARICLQFADNAPSEGRKYGFVHAADAIRALNREALSSPAEGGGAPTLPEGHDKPCYYCGEPCDSLAGNPGRWPIFLTHKDDPGRVKWHHVGCVSERLVENQAPTAPVASEEVVERVAKAICCPEGCRAERWNKLPAERRLTVPWPCNWPTCTDEARAALSAANLVAPGGVDLEIKPSSKGDDHGASDARPGETRGD